ncbi:MAG: DUF2029 domain-containing protein [Acidobacteria bacterium]|nr:DUF2029 domain-containing protein [Acidobacteriota bacterium]
MPGLLLLVARDLLVHDPPRVLAWRALHDPRLSSLPAWLAPLLPRPRPELDADPVALLLGALAIGFAAAYLFAALRGARVVLRAALVAASAATLVVLPTAAFVGLGIATDRPFGQDGGVVQLPLALDRLLAGESPYGADYSDSILGKEARASDFWSAHGGNPILRHHAYLPGTHLAMMPFYLYARALGASFDPRAVTLLGWLLAVGLAVRLVEHVSARLAAAAVVALNPLVYWHQIFGANDLLVVAMVLAAVRLATAGRPLASGALLGLACATKQLAWPFAPFLLVHLSGAGTFGELAGRTALRRLAGPSLVATGVFAAIVAPVAALDLARFWGDIVVYNVGLPGADNYPLGGTPGFGFANYLVYFGTVASLQEHAPLAGFYLLLVPVGLLLLRHQMRSGAAATVLVTGSAALLASLYFSRVVHANYLVLPAILLPLGFLMGERRSADVAAVPLLLLALAVEVAEGELFRAAWEDAVNARLPRYLEGLAATLAPRAGPDLTQDPLGLLVSATAAGLGVAYVVAGILGASVRARVAVVVAGALLVVALPTRALVRIGEATGTPRVQASFAASVLAGMRASDAPPVREAWSASFRRDPPRRLEADVPSPAAPALGRLLRALGLRDPRPLALVALAVSLMLLVVLVPQPAVPLVSGIALLAPPAAVGVAFGSGDVLVLAAALGALLLRARGRSLASGVVLGCVIPLAPLAVLLSPLVLSPDRLFARRALGGLALGAAIITGAALLLDPEGFADGWTLAGPGSGLGNLLLYFGAGDASLRLATLALGAAVVALVAFAMGRGRRAEVRAAAAVGAAALVAGAVLAPWSSPHDLAVPLALLAVASAD